jgi:hypothetical protein
MVRTMLIHANSRWSDSVTINLWPIRYQDGKRGLHGLGTA